MDDQVAMTEGADTAPGPCGPSPLLRVSMPDEDQRMLLVSTVYSREPVPGIALQDLRRAFVLHRVGLKSVTKILNPSESAGASFSFSTGTHSYSCGASCFISIPPPGCCLGNRHPDGSYQRPFSSRPQWGQGVDIFTCSTSRLQLISPRMYFLK